MINGNTRYRLPVVYISKTFNDEDPVDVYRLAGRLKGIAHVLVQKTNCSNASIRTLCKGNNEYYGAIGIYFPNVALGHRRYLYRSSDGIDRILAERVFREVVQYGNRQRVDLLYTWGGVKNALLQDKLTSQRQERTEAENGRREALYELLTLKQDLSRLEENMKKQAVIDAKAEADKILDSFEEEIRESEQERTRLLNDNQRLELENQGLKRKLDSMTAIPVLVMGNEDDFYQGEIKDLVLFTLSERLKNTEPRTRRYDVLRDIIQANDYQKKSEKQAADVKRLLKDYSGMNAKIRKGLEDVGYKLTEDGSHIKGKYYGDDRYTVVYAKTPSDGARTGKNNADITIKKAF